MNRTGNAPFDWKKRAPGRPDDQTFPAPELFFCAIGARARSRMNPEKVIIFVYIFCGYSLFWWARLACGVPGL